MVDDPIKFSEMLVTKIKELLKGICVFLLHFFKVEQLRKNENNAEVYVFKRQESSHYVIFLMEITLVVTLPYTRKVHSAFCAI